MTHLYWFLAFLYTQQLKKRKVCNMFHIKNALYLFQRTLHSTYSVVHVVHRCLCESEVWDTSHLRSLKCPQQAFTDIDKALRSGC